MLFFRTFSLVAALAFATLSSAVPIEGAGLVSSGDVFARDVTDLALPVKRGGSIPDLYNTCHSNVQGIIVNIEVAVKTGNHGVILGHLNEIIAQINILIGGLQVYASVELDISVTVFAGIVCDLIKIIVNVLYLVINISADITACIGVIGGLLGTLIHLTVSVVVGLNVSILGGLLQPIGGILNILGILHIFIGIGISISL